MRIVEVGDPDVDVINDWPYREKHSRDGANYFRTGIVLLD